MDLQINRLNETLTFGRTEVIRQRLPGNLLCHILFPVLSVLLFIFGSTSVLRAQVIQTTVPVEMQGIQVIEHLNEPIPLDAVFTNEDGQTVKIGDYFQPDRPVILTLAYYECPMLCTMVLNALSTATQEITWTPGQEFQMVTISIDPTESAKLAKAKRDRYVTDFGKTVKPQGWTFLVGEESQIKRVANAVGFHYIYDAERDEFGHPAVVFILTPDGKISRYLYGLEYKATDVKFALLEAAAGKFGTTLDRLVLYCFHYDPDAGGYVLWAGRLMRLGGVLTLVMLVVLMAIMWGKEHKKAKLIESPLHS